MPPSKDRAPNRALDFVEVYGRRHWRDEMSWTFEPSAYMECHHLDSGLLLYLTAFTLRSGVTLKSLNIEGCLGFGYCHAGDLAVGAYGSGWPDRIGQSQMAFFSSPGYATCMESFAPGRTARVSVSLPKSMVGQFNDLYEGLLEAAGITMAESPFLKAYAPGAQVRRILADILDCPYRGPLRLIFMEAKAMELFAGSLGDLDTSAALRPQILDRRQRAQAEMAAHLLGESFEAVPTFGEVARRVGLSRCRLADVFQQVHGTTPFAWLRAKRLDAAKAMLAQGSANVTEAAMAVGYTSVSHFTKAFASRFDISPSQCRKRGQVLAP